MTPRAIFFDFDDTLLDHTGPVSTAWELACHTFAPQLGCDVSALRDAIRREGMAFWADEAKAGHWRTNLLGAREFYVGAALQAEGLDISAALGISECYEVELTSRLALFDDALPTLDLLKARGFKLGLITNGPAHSQRAKVTRFEMEQHMDVVVIEGEFGKGKPEPEVFQHAMATVGVDPGEAWMVGDNLYADIGGGRAAGLHTNWIHRDRVQFREDLGVEPHRRIAHLDELLASLDLG